MSRMMLRSTGKPPLARSPTQLRPRRQALQPTSNNCVLTPPESMIKSQLPPKHAWEIQSPDLRPEYHTISCEMRALAKLVHQEFGDTTMADVNVCGGAAQRRGHLFERGRFYDEYAARRNERLKRKKGEMEYEKKKTSYDLGVRFESAKKRELGKFDSRRKAVAKVAAAAAATPMTEKREARTPPRYMLRSSTSKENKKPPLPVPTMSLERSLDVSETKPRIRRTGKA